MSRSLQVGASEGLASAEPAHAFGTAPEAEPAPPPEDDRQALVDEFEGWVVNCKVVSSLKDQIKASVGMKDFNVVADTLLDRSTGTLKLRLGSLRRLGADLGMNPLDVEEDALYKHLCGLRSVGAAPSRGSGCLQACRLAAVLAGIEHQGALLSSRRLVGAAYGPLDGHIRKQRAGFTLRQLEALEQYIVRVDDMLKKAICGQVLFCTYAQARWGDAQRLKHEPVFDVKDGGPGVVEAIAKTSKGQRGLKRLKMETPVVSLAYSVSGARWWEQWRMARVALKLPCCPCLPCVLADRRLGSRAMTSSHAAKWLKATLAMLGEPETEKRPLGSHTCKATMLSWASRWGLSASARRNLGHHLKPGDRISVVYSRDHIIGPLGGLVRMVKSIRDKTWDPDCSRAVLLRASLSSKDAGGMVGDHGTFNFSGADRQKEEQLHATTGHDDESDDDLYDPTDKEMEAAAAAPSSSRMDEGQSEASDQTSTISSDKESDIAELNDDHADHNETEHQHESGETMLPGPYVNEKSGIVHDTSDRPGAGWSYRSLSAVAMILPKL